MFVANAAFQGPALAPGRSASAVTMRAEGEIGVTPPCARLRRTEHHHDRLRK